MDLEVFIPAYDKNGEAVRRVLKNTLAQASAEFEAENRLEITTRIKQQMNEITEAKETNHAYLSTFADLIDQGWSVNIDGDFAELTKPDKNQISSKQQLLARRDESLYTESVSKFLNSCENTTAYHKSISLLFHDGKELKGALEQVNAGKLALSRIIEPELIPVLPDQRDKVTGLLLTDVWRYFRLTWSLEYKSVPGRQLPFLIRNKAHKHKPIMGIGCLASAVLRNSTRDDWLGWSFDTVSYKALSGSLDVRKLLDRLKRTITEKCDLIHKKDLDVSNQDIEKPNNLVIEGLKKKAVWAEEQRKKELKSDATNYRKKHDFKKMSDEDILLVSENNFLWIKKRAEQLAKALECRVYLNSLDKNLSPYEIYSALFIQAEGKSITQLMLSELRMGGTAANIADLSVCGAIPPYNHLLGGKLIALSTFSRELHRAYHERYKSSVSEITSFIAGKKIYRPTNLEAITTTSMYGRSSQYNRIKLKKEQYPSLKRDIQWEPIGFTKGKGVFHFTDETSKLLNEYFQFEEDYRHVNNVFGEGTSPKMRKLKTSLIMLGFNAEEMIEHGQEREFFAAIQSEKSKENLFFGKKSKLTEKSKIKDLGQAWLNRWVVKRILRPETLTAISAESFERLAGSLRPRSYDSQYKQL